MLSGLNSLFKTKFHCGSICDGACFQFRKCEFKKYALCPSDVVFFFFWFPLPKSEYVSEIYSVANVHQITLLSVCNTIFP